MTMDMADLMGKSMGEEAGVSCSKFDYTITYKGFGKVDEIVVPEEVKKAAGTADSDSDDDDDLAALFGDTEMKRLRNLSLNLKLKPMAYHWLVLSKPGTGSKLG